MNRDKITELMTTATTEVDFAVQLSDGLVLEKTQELDALMREIQANVVNAPTAEDSVIEHYLLQLTNALYFINTRCDTFGFFDDITKANAKLKYNQAYAESQLKAAAEGRKPTVADNTLYAENNSVDENVLNIIYSRAAKIIKGKIDTATEMVRTLSKILSSHMNNFNATSTSRRLYE